MLGAVVNAVPKLTSELFSESLREQSPVKT
jgi:hypothetical protein